MTSTLGYTEHKQQLLNLFSLIRDRAQALNQPKVVERLERAHARLTEGKLLVVVCGEFKRGKSSLINALIETPDLCPVDIDITTAIVTTIEWAEKDEITVVLGETGKEHKQEITREEIADYVTEQSNPHNRRQVQGLHIRGPFAPIKEGLVLLDTPGLGSLNTEHGAVTYAILPEADVAVFVTDALKPLAVPELEFVRDWVARYCQYTVYTVTKIDARADYQVSVEDARHKLAVTLNCSADTLNIVPVSSRLKLKSLASGNASTFAKSNFAALEEALWQGLSTQATVILLSRALTAVSQAITDLRTPLEAERDVYHTHASKAAEEREARIKAARDRLRALESGRAEWSLTLKEGLEDIERKLRQESGSRFMKLDGQIDENLANPSLAGTPEEILNLLVGKAIAISVDLQSDFKTEAANLQHELINMTCLNLKAANDLTPESYEKPAVELSKPQRKSFWRKTWDIVLATWDVAVGVFFFWTLPRTLTRLADIVRATFRRETLSPAQIRVQLQKFLRESQLAVQHDRENMLVKLRRAMEKDFKQRIKEDIERCNEILKSVAAARRVPSEEIQQSLNRVERDIQEIDQLQQDANKLAGAIAGVQNVPIAEH